MNVMKRLKAGIAAHQRGRHKAAADAYTDVLKAHPDHPDALHFMGMLMHQLGDKQRGIAAIRKSLSVNPVNAAAHCNLGNIYLSAGDVGEAADAYKAALSVDPLHVETYRNFGVLLRRTGKVPEAIETLKQAAELEPNNIEVWHNLGICYMISEDLPMAAEAFEKCVEQGLNPQLNAVWHARTLLALGREEAALRHLERYLKKNPNDPVARHHIAAIRGETSEKVPEDYVREHFDSFSRSFDEALKGLQYKAPELVAEEVAAWQGDRPPVACAVDLGCGTGLCGPLIAKFCERLVGVDLSPKMLGKAADVGAYHELHEDELVRFLERLDDASVGLAISADTLNYLGDLSPVMAQVARTLTPGAALVATFEDAGEARPETGYRLQNHGRYCHARSYLEQVVAEAGLEIARSRQAALRREAGEDVEGLILTIARPAP